MPTHLSSHTPTARDGSAKVGPLRLWAEPGASGRRVRYQQLCHRLAILLIAAGIALSGCSGNPSRADDLGQLAPGFALQDTDGNWVRLDDFRGQVVMLHFWATWCAPCRAALSHEVKFQEAFAEKGFTVLGLNMDNDRDDVFKFLKRNELNYPTLFLNQETRTAYGGVATIPLTIIIDRSGRIRRKSTGYTLQLITSLERTIETLLEEDAHFPNGS